MAKKRWAYATIDDEYILQKGKKRKRLFFIWEILKLRRISEEMKHKRNPEVDIEFNYDKLKLWSTQNNKNDRKPLISDIRGYLRYKSGDVSDDSNQGGDGESLTHQLAILALSQLNKIPFKVNKKELILDFVDFDLDGEDTKIQFGGGKYFYPDLIGYLSPKSDMYSKWGGKVAIEVKVTHGCEKAKIEVLKSHNFAILEVYISPNFRFTPEVQGRDFNVEDMEIYFNRLVNRFSEETFATLLSNPMVTDYAEACIKTLQSEKKSLESSLFQLNDKLSNIKKQLIDSANDLRETQNCLDTNKQNYEQELKKQLIDSANDLRENQNLLATNKQNYEQELKKEKDDLKAEAKKSGRYVTALSWSTLVNLTLISVFMIMLFMPIFFAEQAVEILRWYFKLVNTTNT
ncbi:hypothetical protein [Moritella viscosa]|uniref:Uncharacterized protein n=1 Tax=Moritella viscosa TaxID=80854 RepID=A0ABY1H786_9GAMM|nr:hypothetical protein [Moritella viscosa]SGY81404.1 Putative uncharacterized protein [Moritella viscosa]SGY81585.1 Putative uncharacterized protein [Moritella viscosa]SHO24004.1 Putative uncharacterized protein [Moritella viscosa]